MSVRLCTGLELSPRIVRLRDAYLAVRPSISIARARAFTEAYRANPGMPPILLRAMAFERACEEAPLLIQPGELIVGHPCGRPRAGAFSPDIAWRWLRDELETIATRPQDPFRLEEEDKQILRSEIFPYWEGRSVDEISETQLREAGLWTWANEAGICDLSIKTCSGGGDTCPGYDNILLPKGFEGVRAEAEARLAALSPDQPEEIEQIYFYRAIVLTCRGAMSYASRLAAHAAELAAHEEDNARRAELERIAAVNAHVPALPPRTFHEALQAIYTAESLFVLEENQTGISLGRLDQYLLPYYEADLRDGRLDRKGAFELLCSFLIKIAETMWLTTASSAKYFAGYQPFINLVVGGQRRRGGDATNELTGLVMDASRLLGIYQPSLACRIHNGSPRAYLEKIVEVVRSGIGFPACHFDDAHIRMMLGKGFDQEDARDYCLMGCVEPQRSGRTYQWTSAGYTQWPVAIELVLSRGVFRAHGTRQGLDTGDPRGLASYEELEAAVKAQLRHMIKNAATATLIAQRIHRDHAPKPLISCLVEGCLESGSDVTHGGAFLNSGPGLIWTGLADYANSMAALRRLVFDEKRYTMGEIVGAVAANFEGYDELRRDCLRAPKYGNDDDEVDLIAADIVDWTEAQHRAQRTLFARMSHGTLSISNNTPQGAITGALPSGRLAGRPLADGISPAQGTDRLGPTAIIRSVSKLNVESMGIGMVHNLKLQRGILDGPEGENGLIALLEAASLLGNGQMQFSYVDNETLRAAQERPEEHRGMMIRVAGYSAFFVELCREVQDEIISRTTLGSFGGGDGRS